MVRILAATLVFMMACHKTPAAEAPDIDEALSEEPTPEPAAEQATAEEAKLTRAAFLEVLDRGPGAFLATVELRPHFVGSAFAGWEIVQHQYESVDLRPGDVVQAVNETVIERPEQLVELWRGLRQAEELTVQATRGGERFVLRVPIVD